MTWFYELILYIVLWALGFAAILPTVSGCKYHASLIGPMLQSCLHSILVTIIVLPTSLIAGGVLYTSVWSAIGGAHINAGFFGIAAIIGLAGVAAAFCFGNYIQLGFVSASTATFDSDKAKRLAALFLALFDCCLIGLFFGMNCWMNKT